MSECVVRMEMPESCDMCPCLDDYGDYPRCRISEEQRGYNFPIHEKRMENCPILCQLPDGHGRLVDADALHKIAWPVKDHTGRIEECVQIRDLYKAPTIVPAEAERSEP